MCLVPVKIKVIIIVIGLYPYILSCHSEMHIRLLETIHSEVDFFEQGNMTPLRMRTGNLKIRTKQPINIKMKIHQKQKMKAKKYQKKIQIISK